MDRTALASELARLEAATPSRVASFNERRQARIAELRALLADAPEIEPVRDTALDALLRKSDAAHPSNRRADRWR